MARSLGDILRRFRPSVAPGPAAPPGVPVDRLTEMASELVPVFAALAPAVAEARQVISDACAEADRRRRGAEEDARAVVAGARAQLEAARAAAAVERLDESASERTALEAASAAEVARVAAAAEARLPALVAEVIDAVWATAGMKAPP